MYDICRGSCSSAEFMIPLLGNWHCHGNHLVPQKLWCCPHAVSLVGGCLRSGVYNVTFEIAVYIVRLLYLTNVFIEYFRPKKQCVTENDESGNITKSTETTTSTGF